MKKKMLLLGMPLVASLLVVGLAPSAEAFHGSWWRGFGTARVGNLVLGLDFVWGGQDAIINCAGGGCQGTGDGWYHYTLNGVALPPITFVQATEDVRNVVIGPSGNCAQLEVTPNYSLVATGKMGLFGRQENCLDNFPLSNNNNHFSGTLDVFTVSIVANGGFTAGVPPLGAADFWCCHG
jgi:hypothetical protein